MVAAEHELLRYMDCAYHLGRRDAMQRDHASDSDGGNATTTYHDHRVADSCTDRRDGYSHVGKHRESVSD
jgi:hypothetical protein